MLALAMHEKAPQMFAIDSFDHAMNPRLARKVTEIFSQKIIEEGKTVFITTHNPLSAIAVVVNKNRFTVGRLVLSLCLLVTALVLGTELYFAYASLTDILLVFVPVIVGTLSAAIGFKIRPKKC